MKKKNHKKKIGSSERKNTGKTIRLTRKKIRFIGRKIRPNFEEKKAHCEEHNVFCRTSRHRLKYQSTTSVSVKQINFGPFEGNIRTLAGFLH